HGDDAHGDDAHGDDAHGDDAHGDDAHGDDAHGDDAHGDDAHGDDAATPPAVAAAIPAAAIPAALPPGAPPPAGGVPSTSFASPGGPPVDAASPERQYTAVLITYASPMAAVMFPRAVEAQTDLLAASPAVETQRLLSLLGIGLDAFRLFGIVLIVAAALGLGIALYNAMRDRRYDLAVMRSLGARRRTLVGHALLEGTLLAVMGTALGLLLGHGAASALGAATAGTRTPIPLTGMTFVQEELALIGLMLGLGIVAALIPAIQAYRTDIARLLARGA
ncbi:MAG: FtsX-like permease family protein, partial [Bacteroidota bacterium]